MNNISAFYLADRGAFDVTPEVNYTSPDGQNGTVTGYKKKLAGESTTIDPGANGTIQNGYTVTLKCDVEAGKDRTASESFIYESSANTTANYGISGLTGNPHLKFLGTTSND